MNTTTLLFEAPGPRGRRRCRLFEIISWAVLAGIAYLVIQTLDKRGAFDAAAWQPLGQLGVWRQLGVGLLNNVRAAVVGMLLSMFFGCFLGWGLLSGHKIVRYPCRAFTDLFNGIPVLLLLFFTSLALPAWGLPLTDFWFLVIALSLYSTAVIADLVRAGVQALPRGESEAAAALGFSGLQSMWLILLPQALRMMSPALVSQMVIVFKGTTLAFVLGGYFDLLRAATVLGAYYSRSLLQAQGIAAVAFMLINIALSQTAAAIDRRERRRYGVPPIGTGSRSPGMPE
ncbi:MAG TPA: amino acid ABC transporter permease [Bordetella sp.]|uniref:amino acid ABC transporter permease n=1 Tax=Bordetella sp. TaxID=28081 RepID=UPI002ED19C6B